MGCNLWDQAGWILSAHFQSLQNSLLKQKKANMKLWWIS